MPVVKSQAAAPLLKEAIVLDLGDIGRQAAKLRLAAENKAAQILTDAERQAKRLTDGAEAKGLEQGLAQGREQGLAEGREQGRAEALEQMGEQLRQLQAGWTGSLKGWDAHCHEMERAGRAAVLDFAIKVAEKLVHRVIEVDESVVVDQLAHALTHVLHASEVTVQIHPDDRPLLEQALPELLAEFDQLSHIKLADDATVGRGGCIVRHGEGRIDATIDTQVRRVVDAILPADANADAAALETDSSAPADPSDAPEEDES
ncbi:MAG: FliH/SctL family protein [Phycisphaeraceae bacterium]